MVEKCKNCGHSIVRFPLKDSEGKWIKKNFFKTTWESVFLFLTIIAIVYGYNHNIALCETALEDPVEYCKENNACRVLINEQVNTQFVDPAGIDIFDINIIEEATT